MRSRLRTSSNASNDPDRAIGIAGGDEGKKFDGFHNPLRLVGNRRRLSRFTPMTHDPATAAHQHRDPFIGSQRYLLVSALGALLDDALHRRWGSMLASRR